MWNLIHDLRFAARVLRRNPGLTTMAALTLGLGFGACTTVFSWIDSVLLRPVPGAAAGPGLVAVEQVSARGPSASIAHPDFRDFQRGADLLSGLAAWHLVPFALGSGRDTQRVYGQVVSANFFGVLGVTPAAGRFFTAAEDRDIPGAFPYAVISHRLWESRFQRDPGLIGSALRVNGQLLTVIGVAPPEFRGSMAGLSLDIWVPLTLLHRMGGVGAWAAEDRNAKPFVLLGRLRPGVTIEQAAAQIRSIAGAMQAAHPRTHEGVSATVLPLWKAHSGVQAVLLSPLRILMACSLLVFLCACANVANLLLSLSVARRKEAVLRLALGASRGRILRQVLLEGLLLSAFGLAVGLLLSQWMGGSLRLLLPATDLPLSGFVETQFNGRVFAFGAAILVVAALACAGLPAMSSSRVELVSMLKEGSRTGSSGTRSHRVRNMLAVVEVSLASLALIGAGLFGKSFQKINNLPLGFDPRNVQVAQLYLSTAGYTTGQERQFSRLLSRRLREAPGVEGAASCIEVPPGAGAESIEVEGYVPRAGESMLAGRNNVGPGYFRLLRIPVLAGREFTDRDEEASQRVVVVNESFARRYSPGRDPAGRRIRVAGGGSWSTIVGVVKDSSGGNPADPPGPMYYAPFDQMFASGHNHYVLVRTTGRERDALNVLRREIAAMDPSGGLHRLQPLTDYVRAASYSNLVAARLMSALAALSLLLAVAGLYSVLAYAISERTHEIGIRMALGARPRQVLAMVLRQGMGLTAAGFLLGACVAWVSARLVSNMLVGVGPADPFVAAAAAAVLVLVALLACYMPARRAVRLDPVQALRCQ